MNYQKTLRLVLLAGAALLTPASPRQAAAATAMQPTTQLAATDGAHDFDFNFGTWHTHITRVLDPFSGGTHTLTLEGTVTVHKVWDGRAQLEEIEADGPRGHWEGLTLFLYNPVSQQWSQNYVDSKDGQITTPLVGAFKNGRGDLYATEEFNNKSVLIRGVWSNITPDAHHFEEDFSDDGGAHWMPAFIASLTREK
ncbi:MAG TPA: hypothetical protein VMB71_09160 [Acetobacteraceae bacterium]|nr:hypothetical protein [Acetobacteraceae bacterium]